MTEKEIMKLIEIAKELPEFNFIFVSKIIKNRIKIKQY